VASPMSCRTGTSRSAGDGLGFSEKIIDGEDMK